MLRDRWHEESLVPLDGWKGIGPLIEHVAKKTVHCSNCGKEFEPPKGSIRKTCSAECKQEKIRITDKYRAREYRKRKSTQQQVRI